MVWFFVYLHLKVSKRRSMEEEKVKTSEALQEKADEGDTHTIEITISVEVDGGDGVEVVGEDKPLKYAMRRARWRKRVGPSFIAICISIVACVAFLYTPYIYYCVFALGVSVVAFYVSIYKVAEIHPDEVTDTMPWWYGGL